VLVLVVVLPTSPRRLKLREATPGRLSSIRSAGNQTLHCNSRVRLLDRSISEVGTKKDEGVLLGSYPIKGLSMTAKECGVSR
jgi:hypothetical protein